MREGQMMTDQPGTIELYDGRVHRGSVSFKAGKFIAVDSDGRKLGSFAARQAAIDAITATSAKSKSRSVH
jgi:hypothetical protein